MTSPGARRETPATGPDVDCSQCRLHVREDGRAGRRRSSASRQLEQPRSEPLFNRGNSRVADRQAHADLAFDLVDVGERNARGPVLMNAEPPLDPAHESTQGGIQAIAERSRTYE